MLIIARYNEDISWADAYPNKVIYNKGEPLEGTIQLPNLGREAGTYLQFIIDHYDKLNTDEVYVFTQGRYSDHISEESFRHLFTIRTPQSIHNISQWGSDLFSYGFRFSYCKEYTLTPTKYDENFGQWYERMFNRPFEDMMPYVYVGAIFSVKGSSLKMYPKEFYENLLSEVNISSVPECGHYMERLWALMFML